MIKMYVTPPTNILILKQAHKKENTLTKKIIDFQCVIECRSTVYLFRCHRHMHVYVHRDIYFGGKRVRNVQIKNRRICLCNAVVFFFWPSGLLINLINCQCKQPYGWWKIHDFFIYSFVYSIRFPTITGAEFRSCKDLITIKIT